MTATKTAEYLAALETELRDTIKAAYKDELHPAALRDFVRNMAWRDAWEELVKEETANERKHEGWRPSGIARSRISNRNAALILLFGNIADGCALESVDPEWVFTLRPSAYKAMVLGFLIRTHVHQAWIAAAKALDYCEAKRPTVREVIG